MIGATSGSRLKKAIRSGCYQEALRLLSEYAREADAPEHPEEALRLLSWAARTVRAGRAHAALELARLSAGHAYHTRPRKPPALLHLDA